MIQERGSKVSVIRGVDKAYNCQCQGWHKHLRWIASCEELNEGGVEKSKGRLLGSLGRLVNTLPTHYKGRCERRMMSGSKETTFSSSSRVLERPKEKRIKAEAAARG